MTVKAITFTIAFFTLAPLTIALSFISLFSLNANTLNPASSPKTLIESPRFGSKVFAALPTTQQTIHSGATAADARIEIVRQYLLSFNSPLASFADLVVATSDQYNLDPRLLVAIAQQESNLCKKAPEGSHNCWGWGIHSRGTLAFPDYPTAIQTVAQGIKEEYIDKGYDTVEKMMEKYTPLSNGSWAAGVNQFLAEMQ